ncbi:DegT/DnrJ/EryC1/StrS family aminotransferase [Cytobacillus pseudoceanisediminis]|uniref:DegT/DnrJ/EryC1/StrS family aminotransferase n=1 Tax=Cytobacillus pseudoceanisediminis TaxID=3051614 RepID=UPI00365FB1E7
MRIPYVDLGLQHSNLLEEINLVISKVISSGSFILGEQVRIFEENISKRIGCKYAIGVNSGTDALILSLLALGIRKGDEVITVPNSFLATVAAIELIGAKAVLVDVCDDQNIDVKKIRNKITPKTKAIIPVHLTGRPSSMSEILEIAKEFNIKVIEDCSQAFDAEYMGKKVGSLGDVGAFSLHPLKNLGACGDAGVVVTDQKEVADYIRLIRNHGLINRDECVQWGYNSRLDEIQAAILNVKLKYLDKWNNRKREIAKMYFDGLENTPIRLPIETEDRTNVYHAFVIKTDLQRELKEYLESKSIEVKIHYPIPIHKQTASQHNDFYVEEFKIAEKQSGEILSLPIYPELTNDQVNEIIFEINSFFNNSKYNLVSDHNLYI